MRGLIAILLINRLIDKEVIVRLKPLLFLATAILAVWNAALIWMTQVMCYPLWQMVGSANFHGYHVAWWHSVWWTFITAGLELTGSIFLLFWRPRYFSLSAAIIVVAAQCIALFATLVYWAPLQAGLSTPSGLDMAGFHALLWTHWFRVALIWIPAIVMSQVLAQRILQIPE
jgi:hypothetical protein